MSSQPFTIYIGNELVADLHIHAPESVKIYEPVPAEYHLGGSHVFNAASIAHQIKRLGLNGQVSILGTISKDVFGQHFIENCADMGIKTDHVVRVNESTLVAIVTHGKENNSFYFPNGASNALLATESHHLPDLSSEEHTMLIMQGVCSLMEPSGKHWLSYAESLPKTLIIYDVNARPSLIRDLDKHRKLVDSWASQAGVIKISDADIEAIYPGNEGFEKVAGHFLACGSGLVVETRGEKSVRTLSHNGLQEFAIPKLANIHNTVGAGDNFMAGLTLSFAKAGVFTAEHLKTVSRDDIAGFIETAIATAREHLERQNGQASPPAP